MATDDIFEAGADANEAVSEIKRLVDQLTNLDAAMRQAKSGSVSFNAAGNVIRANLRGIVDDATQMSASFVKGRDGMRLATVGFNETSVATSRLRDETRRLREEQRLLNEQQARGRNAAALGASIGGGGFSFTSLGRTVSNPNLSAGGNLALGLSAGLVAGAADAALGAIKNTLSEGAASAFEFNKQIALINTITKDGTSTTDSWSKAVRQLSRDFNIDEVEVAQGAYQALSNQILKGSKDVGFLDTALRLAKTTNSSVTQSVDALSSVLNSFGTKAGSASDIADKLFKGVDLGNFKLSEVANTLGRVTSLANPLGVSFTEVLASLETVTIQGVKADEALSALSNLYSELLKPSDKLRQVMTQLGFATAEQGIATLRYSGFLKALTEEARKSGISLEELFPNIRGLREALLESNDGFERLNSNLKETANASGTVAEGLEKVHDAAGERTKKALNELKEAASEIWTSFLRRSDSVLRVLDRISEESAKQQAIEQERRDAARARGEVVTERTGAGIVVPFEGTGTERRNATNKLALEQAQAEFERKNRLKELTDVNANQVFAEADKLANLGKRASVDQQALENDAHQARLKKIAELRAAKFKDSQEENANVRATSKQFLENLDRRRVAFEEFRAQERDVGGGDALATALKIANPEQAKKLIDERIGQLQEIAGKDLADAAKLGGKDFVLDKSLEDAKKAADLVVKLRTEQRDAAIHNLAPGDRDAALAAVTQGAFGSLTGLGAPSGEVAKAQEALDEAKSERIEIEEKALKIIKEKGEEIKKQRDAQILDNDRFKAGQQFSALAGQSQGPQADVANSIVRLIDELRIQGLANKSPVQDQLVGFGGIRTLGQSAPSSVVRIDVANEAIITNKRVVDESSASFVKLTDDITNFRFQLSAARALATAAGAVNTATDAINAGFGRLGFAAGGPVPGIGTTDTVPAMLSPGEYVWDRATTRAFWPIIEAAHHGRLRGFNDGGPVTLNGGINVAVQGGSTSQATIGEIARGLEREFRRGSVRPWRSR